MRFALGTPVHTNDGRRVGSVDRVVVSGTQFEIEHIVVHKGHFFTRDVIVPMRHVSLVDDDGVHLDLDEHGVDVLEDFSEEHYTFPPVGSPLPTGFTMGTVMFPMGIEPGVAPMAIEERKHLEPGAAEIGRGYAVRCMDSDLGVVRDVMVDAEEDVLIELIIESGDDELGEVRVPAALIARIEDEVVILACTREEFRAATR